METQVSQTQAYTPEQQATDLICDAQKFLLPESLQVELLELARKCNTNGLVLLDGPPGSGKTTAATLLTLLANQAPSQFTPTPTASSSSGNFGSFRRGSRGDGSTIIPPSTATTSQSILSEKLQNLSTNVEFQMMIQSWNVTYAHIPDAASAEEWLEECKRRQEAPAFGKHQAPSRFAKLFRKFMPPRGGEHRTDSLVELHDLYVQNLREFLLPIQNQSQQWSAKTNQKSQKMATKRQRQIVIVDNVDVLENLCADDEAFEKAVELVWSEALQEFDAKQNQRQQQTSKTQNVRETAGHHNTCLVLITTNQQTRWRFTHESEECKIVSWPDLKSADVPEEIFKYTGGRLSLYQKWLEFPEAERKTRMDALLRTQMREVLEALTGRADDGNLNTDLQSVDVGIALLILDGLVRNFEGRSSKHITDLISKNAKHDTGEESKEQTVGITPGENTLLQLMRYNLVYSVFSYSGERLHFFLPATPHIKHLWKKERKALSEKEITQGTEDGILELATVPAAGPSSDQQVTASEGFAEIQPHEVPTITTQKRHKHKHEPKSRERRTHNLSASSTGNLSGRSTPEPPLMLSASQGFDALPISLSHPTMWCRVTFLPDWRTQFPALPPTRAAPHGSIRDTFFAAAEYSWRMSTELRELTVTFYLRLKGENGQKVAHTHAENDDDVEVLAPDAPVICCCFDGSTKGEVYYFIHDDTAKHQHSKKKGHAAVEGENATQMRKHRHTKKEAKAEDATEVSETQNIDTPTEAQESAKVAHRKGLKHAVIEKTRHRRSSSVPDERGTGHHRHSRHAEVVGEARRKHRHERKEDANGGNGAKNGGQQRRAAGVEEGAKGEKLATPRSSTAQSIPVRDEGMRNEQPNDQPVEQATGSPATPLAQQGMQEMAQETAQPVPSNQQSNVRLSPASYSTPITQGQRGSEENYSTRNEIATRSSPLSPPQPQSGPPAPMKSAQMTATQTPNEEIRKASPEQISTNAQTQNVAHYERRDL